MPNSFSVDVATYCDGCKSFIPEVRIETFGNNMCGYKTYQHIYCRNKQICADIHKHLEDKLKEKLNG